MVLKHDNARPHTANIRKVAIQERCCEVISHPHYSPDLATLTALIFKESSLMTRRTLLVKSSRREKLIDSWEAIVANGGEYVFNKFMQAIISKVNICQ